MTSTVAIINWNSGRRLRPCIESLLATRTRADILVIDNASDDDSVESVQGFRNRIDFVRNSVNRGFAAAVNQAFHATSSAYLLILNPDLQAMPGAIQRLEEFMEAHPRAAAAGGHVGDKYLPKRLPTVTALVRENLGLSVGAAYYSAFALSRSRSAYSALDNTPPVPVDQPAAAALMIRRDAYEEVGGFDEQFYPAWYEDVDFCRRLKSKGWEIYFIPQAAFLHEGGYSAGAMGSQEFLRSYYGNQIRYAGKHFGAMGALAVRVSVAAGMIERMILKPSQAFAYGKVFIGCLKGW